MFKKSILLACFFLAFACPLTSEAVNLDSAFGSLGGNMVTSSGPAAYSSQSRNIYMAGGIDVRVPRSSGVTLFSVTPPTLDIGCNGISAHFGGFSFITGAQIEQLIKNISQNSTGLVMQLVIKTLCPQCEAVLQVMQSLSQKAAALAIDSCQAGAYLQNFVKSEGLAPTATGTRSVCGTTMTTYSNEGSDYNSFMEGVDSACSTVNDALGNVEKAINGMAGGDPVKAAQMKRNIGIPGNETWEALKIMGYNPMTPSSGNDPISSGGYRDRQQMVLLMNLLGTSIVSGNSGSNDATTAAASTSGASGASAASAPSVRQTTDGMTSGVQPDALNYGHPTFVAVPDIDAKTLFMLFMCGSTDAGAPDYVKQIVDDYCGSFFAQYTGTGGSAQTLQNTPIITCDNADWLECKSLTTTTLGASGVLQGAGFVAQVGSLLDYGVTAIQQNNPIYDSGNQDARAVQLLRLMNTAPYPIYQAINAAAVYPASTRAIIASMTLLVAESLATNLVDDTLSVSLRITPSDGKGADPRSVQRLTVALEALRGEGRELMRQVGEKITIQETIQAQIAQINKQIQKQVMTDELLGNQRYVKAIMDRAASGAGVPPATTTTTGN
ncbi:conjugal transfer protein TraH [Paraburkholderia sp. UCT31]|uniref:conjugal transfer protein TraH n=1 Tax=Paraburkholderia sp. UCT31 TaxID=2615209 RepID=UPI001656166B|nr:conjugal transfer protein TraH [Paraburkholderia sp. UCT31]